MEPKLYWWMRSSITVKTPEGTIFDNIANEQVTEVHPFMEIVCINKIDKSIQHRLENWKSITENEYNLWIELNKIK